MDTITTSRTDLDTPLRCDWCRFLIEEHEPFIEDDFGLLGELRPHHYHEGHCWDRLTEAIRVVRKRIDDDSVPLGAIDRLDIAPVALRALQGSGVHSLADASDRTAEDLSAIPGVGRATIQTLEKALKRYGMSFWADSHEISASPLTPNMVVTVRGVLTPFENGAEAVAA